MEKRIECYNSYVGSKGRTKDIGLFYMWLVWETRSPQYCTRMLPPDVGSQLGLPPVVISGGASSSSGASPEAGNHSSRFFQFFSMNLCGAGDTNVSKKARKEESRQEKAVKSIVSKMAEFTSPSTSSLTSPALEEYYRSKTKLADAALALTTQSAAQQREARLLALRNSSSFATDLDEETQMWLNARMWLNGAQYVVKCTHLLVQQMIVCFDCCS